MLQVSAAFAVTVSVRVSTGNDDAEELVFFGGGNPAGDMYRGSSDLEMSHDSYHGGIQIVGLRFQNMAIPQGATINSAYIEFTSDETSSGTTNLVVYGQDIDSANEFGTNNFNISTRTKTSASATWSPSAWTTTGTTHQTSDISTIIKEIIDRPGWSSGNDLAIIIEPGSGCATSSCRRTAESYNGSAASAPLLVVDYTSVGGGGSCETFADNFSSTSFSNNDGSQNFSGPWNELGESNGAGSEDVNITGGRLHIQDNDNGLSRELDLSAYTTATVTFGYEEVSMNNSDEYVDLQIRTGGTGSWNQLQRFGGPTNDSGVVSIDISGYLASDTEIRFFSSSASNMGNGDDFYADNFEIEACTTSTTTTPLVEYRMDESAWSGATGEVIDNQSNLNATAVNGASTASSNPAVAGDPGTCGYGAFDGSNDYIDVSGLSNLAGSFTITAWIYADRNDGDRRIFADDQNNNGGFAFSLGDGGNGRLRFFSRGVNPVVVDTQNAVINTGQWYHVAAVHNASSQTRQIFVDGIAVNLSTGGTSSTYAGSWGSDSGVASIGGENNASSEGTANFRFDGLIDEVRVYNSALNQSEISAVMNETHACSGLPYAWFQLDETTGSLNGTAGELVDQQGNANAAFALDTGSGVDTLPARVCNGLDVPANTSNTAQYGFDSGIDVDDDIGGQGSINFWFRSDSNWVGGGNRSLFDASPDNLTNPDHYFLLALRNDGSLVFGLEDTNDGDFRIYSAPQNVLAGVWAHLAVTWDIDGERRLYLNGSLIGSESAATNGNIGEFRTLYFGDNRSSYHPDGSASSANGVFDEVRIYQSVQSAADIVSDMNATHTCATPVLDHFNINIGAGAANSCTPFEITITAEDSSNQTITGYTGTVNISTSSGNGNFATVTATNNTSPNPDNDDNGNVDYSFDALDNGFIRMSILNPHIESVTLTVSDSVAGVTSSTAPATITFAEAGFTITDTDANITGSDVAVAGRNHAYRIEAVRRDPSTGICGIATGYTGSKPLKLWRTKNASDPAAALAPALAGITLDPTEPAVTNGNITFNNGVADVSLATSDIGKFTIEIKDDSGSFTVADIAGSSAEQIVRPFGIDIDFGANLRDADFADDGSINGSGGNVSYAIDHTGTVFTQAGEDFTTIVTAVLWNSADDSNDDGIPDGTAFLGNNAAAPAFGGEGEIVTLSASNARPGSLGLLSGSSFASFSGGSQSQLMSYANVGLIDISANLSDNDYFGSGVDITGFVPNVGRFNPFHYAVTSPPTIIHGCAAGSFTYGRQPFMVDLTLQAQNKAGTITDGYRGNYVTLSGATPLNLENSATGAAFDTTTFTTSETFDAGTAGAATYNIELQWDMPLQAPTDSSVEVVSANDEVGTVTGAPVTVGTTNMRFGRITLENVFGSELAGLVMPMRTKHFDGNNFILNTDDSCTDIPDLNLGVTQVLSGGSSTVGVISPTAASGVLDISLSAPGSDNIGYIDVTPDLSAAGSGEPWLQFDWNGDGNNDNNPTGRATFGIFSGDGRQIYYRQIYQ